MTHSLKTVCSCDAEVALIMLCKIVDAMGLFNGMKGFAGL